MTIVDCISDLHGYYPKLEGGDLLIVAGDLTARHSGKEQFEFNEWLDKQPYRKIVLIAGNHDTWIERVGIGGYDGNFDWKNFEYLCDSGTEFEGLKIWGSPRTKTFPGMNPHCKAFTCDTEEQLAEKWALIPDDIDILICHSPAYGVLDEIERYTSIRKQKESVGSVTLRECLDRIKPKLFICGHIHEQGGKMIVYKHIGKNTICVNASHVNEVYDPVNKPIRILL